MTSTLTQAHIDNAYEALVGFDPECRNGDIKIRLSDTDEIKEQKNKRLTAYEERCQVFRDLCEKRTLEILALYHSDPLLALKVFPHNTIPQCEVPRLDLPDYELLMGKIATQNRDAIAAIIDSTFSNTAKGKHDPYKIYESELMLLKTRFRIEFGSTEHPLPRIILGGWRDYKKKVELTLDEQGYISSESETLP